MTGPGGGSNVSQACAACKHQRRKCAPDCVLAPYFPPHRQTEFLNVHKLFGVRNIMNTVKNVEPNRRDDAVRAMIHEAYYRAVDPAGGACRILNNLEQRYAQMKTELDLVHQQLAIFRSIQMESDSDQLQHTPTFYSDLMAQDFGDVFQPQSTQSGNPISSNIVSPQNNILPAKQVSSGTIKKEGSFSNRDKEALQSVPYESRSRNLVHNTKRIHEGDAKIDNSIDKNNSSSSPGEREENETNCPEDVKPNVKG